jgi:hypothetical protein
MVGPECLSNGPIFTFAAKDFLGLHASFSPTNWHLFVFI